MSAAEEQTRFRTMRSGIASVASSTTRPVLGHSAMKSLSTRSSSLLVSVLAITLLAPAARSNGAQAGSTARDGLASLSAHGSGVSRAPTSPTLATTCAPDWIPTFGGKGAPNGSINALLAFDDGSGSALYAGGSFTAIGSVAANRIARWDGGVWTPLESGLDDTCQALVTFDDGSGPALYAAGRFANAGGQPAPGVAKWTGSAWVALGTGLAGSLSGGSTWAGDLATFDDGSGTALYITGDFTSAGGVNANGIARWSGMGWSALANGLNGPGHALARFDDGGGEALHVGGEFTRADGLPAARIAKWNGSSWSPLGAGIGGAGAAVYTLAAYTEAGVPSLYVGGWFNSAGGASATGLARWDGSQWHWAGDAIYFFSPKGTVPGAVYRLTTFDDGSGPKLHVGGHFNFLGGMPASRIAKRNGGSWSALASGTNQDVLAMAGFDDGSGSQLYVGGFFGLAGGLVTGSLARWSGSTWSSIFWGVSGIRVLTTFDDGTGKGPELYAVGSITSSPGVATGHVSRWDGWTWTSITPGTTGPGPVWALAVFDDGTGPALYAAGGFTVINGVSANHIARWNGSTWSPIGTGINDYVFTLDVLDDGTGPALYAGGSFTFAGGVAAQCIAKWNGSTWSALSSGLSHTVQDITLYDDGTGPHIYAAGQFVNAGGVPANYIARWSGSAWSPLGAGVGSHVRSLAVYDDGSGAALYAAGEFLTAGGAPANHVARWDGSAWSSLGSGLDGLVRSLAVFDGGAGAELYAGGTFADAGGTSADNVARWNGASWAALGGGVLGDVHVVQSSELAHGTALLVGGDFAASPSADAALARWGCSDSPATPFCVGDGTQATACPCANSGAPGKGCENSAGTGGAALVAAGTRHPDTIVLTSAGELPAVLSIFLQGNQKLEPGVAFGDGVRCVGGALKRLYVKNASGGIASAPQPGDLSITDRSAALGDPIASGTSRCYQVYYRDSNLAFCPEPTGNSWNVSSAVRILW